MLEKNTKHICKNIALDPFVGAGGSEKIEISNIIKERRFCDQCGKPAVWAIRVFSNLFFRCKEHTFLMSKEYQNYVFYKDNWVLVWDVQEDFEKYGGWCKTETMGDARRKGLKKLGIPIDDYL